MSRHELVSVQLSVHVEPVQLARHAPVAGQLIVQVVEVQLHGWPPMQAIVSEPPVPPLPQSLLRFHTQRR